MIVSAFSSSSLQFKIVDHVFLHIARLHNLSTAPSVVHCSQKSSNACAERIVMSVGSLALKLVSDAIDAPTFKSS